MRIPWLSLCVGLVFAALPGRAQPPGGEPAPFLFVYVARFGENALPRIALGLEKPALKIMAFEKCTQLSDVNPKLMGLAAQLKADDLKTLTAAMKALGAPDAHELPDAIHLVHHAGQQGFGLREHGHLQRRVESRQKWRVQVRSRKRGGYRPLSERGPAPALTSP